jgi:hypothetical protein
LAAASIIGDGLTAGLPNRIFVATGHPGNRICTPVACLPGATSDLADGVRVQVHDSPPSSGAIRSDGDGTAFQERP